MNKFWENWINKTETEKELIFKLKKAMPIIKKEIHHIQAIYVKGTFPRRETIKESDIDLVLIFKIQDYENKKLEIKEALKKQNLEKINISTFSLQELEKGKTKWNKNTKRFSKHVNEYELLLGKKLEKKYLTTRSDEEDFKKIIKAFKEIFLPAYKKEEMSIHEIAKQVFWLTDNELRSKKIKPKNTWKELEEQIKKIDSEHIFLEAHKIRKLKSQSKKISKKQEKEVIRKIKKYIEKIND